MKDEGDDDMPCYANIVSTSGRIWPIFYGKRFTTVDL
jgi:hypothetical protein